MARRYTVDDLRKMTLKELEKVYPNMAKKANMDLRALEKADAAKGSRAYRYIKKLSFDQDEVKKNAQGNPYFQTSIRREKDESDRDYRHRIFRQAVLIAQFRSKPTHTVKGVEKAYEKTYQTWLNRRAAKLAGERYGSNATKAQVLKVKKEIDTMSGKAHFNQAWGDFNKDQYIYMQHHSEVVAILISEGYKADELLQALDKMDSFEKSDPAMNRWRELMDEDRAPATE